MLLVLFVARSPHIRGFCNTLVPGEYAIRTCHLLNDFDSISYCSSSSSSSPLAIPKTVPSNFPVFVNSAGALAALRKTGAMVAVIVRLPDAPVKRPVPPLHQGTGFWAGEIARG